MLTRAIPALWLLLSAGAGALLPLGCGGTGADDLLADARLTAAPAGLVVTFAHPVELREIEVRDGQGQLVGEQPLAGRRTRWELPVDWTGDGTYRVLLVGEARQHEHLVEVKEGSPARVMVEAPPGQDALVLGETTRTQVLMPSGGKLPLTLVVENRRQATSQVQVRAIARPGARLTAAAADWSGDSRQLSLACELSIAQEWREFGAWVELDEDQAEGVVDWEVLIRAGEATWTERLELQLVRMDEARLRQLVVVADEFFPADALGNPQPERQADTLLLPDDALGRLRRWLFPWLGIENRHAELARAALVLENRSAATLNLLIESEVRPAEGGEPLLAFAPPAWLAPHESPTQEHLVRLAPRERVTATLPFYARPEVEPGEYRRVVRVRLFGGEGTLLERDEPLRVLAPRWGAVAMLLAAVGASAVLWSGLVMRGNRLVQRIGVEGLSTISLVAGLYFVASYAARVGGDLLTAAMGPFALFVAGVGNEGLTSLLIAALVVLLPVRGVVLLLSLTVFLLQAVFTGQCGLVDLLFVSVSILCFEGCLWLAGITGRDRAGARRQSPWRVALALGIANALALGVQFSLLETLYRLYFATWYVVTVALVTGLVYGAVGAAWGARLGLRLRSTAR